MQVPVPVPVLDLKTYDATTGTPTMKWRHYLKTKTNMVGAIKTLQLDPYCSKTMNETKFLLLYDVNLCSILHPPYWKCDRFSLEDMNDDKYQAEFRFLREDVFTLHDIVNIPQMFTRYNGVKVTGIEGLCIPLRRYSYPNRYLDLIPMLVNQFPSFT